MVIIKDKYWKSTPSNFYEKTSYVNFENNRIYNFKKIETIYNFHFRSLTVDRYYFQNKYDCIYP